MGTVLKNEVDGRKLDYCKSMKKLRDLIEMKSVEISLLFNKIKMFRACGVPLHLLQGATYTQALSSCIMLIYVIIVYHVLTYDVCTLK